MKCSGKHPQVLVSHRQLMKAPVPTVNKLFSELSKRGVRGLNIPSAKEINSFINSDLYREKCGDQVVEKYAHPNQIKIYKKYQNGEIWNLTSFSLSDKSLQSLKEYEALPQKKNKISNKKSFLDSMEFILWKELSFKEEKVKSSWKEICNLEFKLENLSQQLKEAVNKSEEQNKELKQKDQALLAAQKEGGRLEGKPQTITQQLKDALEKEKKLEKWLGIKEQAIKIITDEKDQLEVQLESKEKSLNEDNHKWSAVQKELELKESELMSAYDKISKINSDFQIHKAQADKNLVKMQFSVAELKSSLDKIIEGINALWRSRRWRFGNTLFSLRYKLLFRKHPLTPSDIISEVIANYEKWSKEKPSKNRNIKEKVKIGQKTWPFKITEQIIYKSSKASPVAKKRKKEKPKPSSR